MTRPIIALRPDDYLRAKFDVRINPLRVGQAQSNASMRGFPPELPRLLRDNVPLFVGGHRMEEILAVMEPRDPVSRAFVFSTGEERKAAFPLNIESPPGSQIVGRRVKAGRSDHRVDACLAVHYVNALPLERDLDPKFLAGDESRVGTTRGLQPVDGPGDGARVRSHWKDRQREKHGSNAKTESTVGGHEILHRSSSFLTNTVSLCAKAYLIGNEGKPAASIGLEILEWMRRGQQRLPPKIILTVSPIGNTFWR